MTYSEKLKDPRWQKKRLEILERDDWTCRWCFDSESTLHIHHVKYKKGSNPWEYSNDDLITICEDCHTSEHEYRQEAENNLINELKKYNHSIVTEVMILLHSIEECCPFPFEVILTMIEKTLLNKKTSEIFYENFFEYISNKKIKSDIEKIKEEI